MGVDRLLVGEQQRLVRAVGHAHDVDAAELGAALAPVGVRHDVVAAHLAAGVELAARRHGPVEERVVARHRRRPADRLDVFEERREPPQHAAAAETLGGLAEAVEGQPRLGGALRPEAGAGDEFARGELALERGGDAPFEGAELLDRRLDDGARLLGAAAGGEAAAADVADAEGEQRLRRHQPERLRPRARRQLLAVPPQRVAGRRLQRRPQPVGRTGGGGVGGADHDVPGERVLAGHEVERPVQAIARHAPRDERARREPVRDQRLPHPPDHARLEHRADAAGDDGGGHAGQRGDVAQRVAPEAVEAILGHGEDRGVDRIADGRRRRGGGRGGHGGGAQAPAPAGRRPTCAASAAASSMRRQVNIGVSRSV